MLGKYGTSLAIYVPGSYVWELEGKAVLSRRSVGTRTGEAQKQVFWRETVPG